MKKIIVSFATAMFVAILEAATVSWSANGISASAANSDRSTYMAYIFDTSAGYATVCSALSSGNMDVLDSAMGSKSVSATGAVTLGKATSAAVEGDYVTAFAVVLDGSASTAKNYLSIAEVTSSKAVSSAGTVTIGFGSQAGNTGWTAVPEPTSGLLLLLGMAGLALKRKHA